MQFKISANHLTQFIRSYHRDLLGSETWRDGTSTEVHANQEYCDTLNYVWGVQADGWAYKTNADCFIWEVLDVEKIRSTGLIGYGEILDD